MKTSGTRQLKGQQSLFRTHSEASKLVRAADDLISLRCNLVKYKDLSIGVKIKDALITNKLSEEEAEIIIKTINSALDNCAVTLCQKAHEITNSIVINLSNRIKPSEENPIEEQSSEDEEDVFN